MRQSINRQSGFTLVEIAIVLVIIGLLLGGVLKGQELIENSKIKSIVNDMNGVSAAYNGYVDRFKSIPGDETAATMTARGWPGTFGGNANGVLGATLAQTFAAPANNEAGAFWRAMYASGLLAGDATTPTLPRNSAGGLVGVNGAATYGNAGPTVCVSSLSTKQIAGVDTAIDGALPATQIGANVGRLRGATGAAPLAPVAAAPAGTAYSETAVVTPWTACRPI